jgi:hypothetical protein
MWPLLGAGRFVTWMRGAASAEYARRQRKTMRLEGTEGRILGGISSSIPRGQLVEFGVYVCGRF